MSLNLLEWGGNDRYRRAPNSVKRRRRRWKRQETPKPLAKRECEKISRAAHVVQSDRSTGGFKRRCSMMAWRQAESLRRGAGGYQEASRTLLGGRGVISCCIEILWGKKERRTHRARTHGIRKHICY